MTQFTDPLNVNRMNAKGVNSVTLHRERVERLRRQKLMTVSELAARVGCSGRTIWAARTGRPVSFAIARAIAGALGVRASEIVQSLEEVGGASERETVAVGAA